MRILFLTHRLPYAPDRGDRVRAYHVLRHLRTFAQVDLISLVHSEEEASHAADLAEMTDSVQIAPVSRVRSRVAAVRALMGHRPLTHALLDSPALPPAIQRIYADRAPDLVLALCSGISSHALTPPLDRVPLAVDMIDVDSKKWAELAVKAREPLGWIYRREARELAKFEAELTARARVTLLVTDRERDELRRITSAGRVEVVPIGIDLEYFAPPPLPEPKPSVVLCGVMNYPPNEEGAVWLAQEIWPRVRRALPEASLTLVGSSPTRRVQALASVDARIEVTGHVPDVRPYLHRAAVSVAPLRTARGVQNKVLEALAAGLPCIITSPVAAGLPTEVLAGCRTGDTAEEFAAHLTDTLSLPPDERRTMAGAADVAALGWRQRLAPLQSLFEDAIQQIR